MGAAAVAVVTKLATSGVWYAVVIRTILINVAIGGLSVEADGETWVACDD